ncbi:hypothetical protein KFE80_03250 [bacterium SCSIO 12696]|nr:hypothetical protein KFE80_03250 [bacterium SCSIO 12696]
MKKIFLVLKVLTIILISQLVFVTSACAEKKRTPDGRMGSDCYLYHKEEGAVEICDVIIPQLVVTPERYHKKIVRVLGYMSASQEAYGLNGSDGARVWVEMETRLEINKLKKYHGKFVEITAEFDALSFGHLGQWGGTLKNIKKIRLLEKE